LPAGGQGLRKACCQAKLLEVIITAPVKLKLSKKRNAEFSEIKKRLQGENALVVESSFWLQAVVGNQLAVDNNIQAWHPLKVLDTIEKFRFSLGIPDK